MNKEIEKQIDKIYRLLQEALRLEQGDEPAKDEVSDKDVDITDVDNESEPLETDRTGNDDNEKDRFRDQDIPDEDEGDGKKDVGDEDEIKGGEGESEDSGEAELNSIKDLINLVTSIVKKIKANVNVYASEGLISGEEQHNFDEGISNIELLISKSDNYVQSVKEILSNLVKIVDKYIEITSVAEEKKYEG